MRVHMSVPTARVTRPLEELVKFEFDVIIISGGQGHPPHCWRHFHVYGLLWNCCVRRKELLEPEEERFWNSNKSARGRCSDMTIAVFNDQIVVQVATPLVFWSGHVDWAVQDGPWTKPEKHRAKQWDKKLISLKLKEYQQYLLLVHRIMVFIRGICLNSEAYQPTFQSVLVCSFILR